MAYTPPDVGDPNWGAPLNQALSDIDTGAQAKADAAQAAAEAHADALTAVDVGALPDTTGLDGLSDVDTTGAAEGETLSFSSGTGSWVPGLTVPTAPADIGAATATQGALADTAVQPADLSTVATTGAYADLTGTPAIPNSPDDIGAATSAQGVLADTALQPGDAVETNASGQPLIGTTPTVAAVAVVVANGAAAPAGLPDDTLIVELA